MGPAGWGVEGDITATTGVPVPGAGTDEGEAGFVAFYERELPVQCGGRRLSVVWPDGRSIDVSATGAGTGREVLQRVADSVVVATEADLAGLRGEAEALQVGAPRGGVRLVRPAPGVALVFAGTPGGLTCLGARS